MSKTARELYQDFHELYGRAHPDLAKGKAHDEVNLKWNGMKKDGKLDQDAYNLAMSALRGKLNKRKLTMFDFSNNKVARRVTSPPAPSDNQNSQDANDPTSSSNSGAAASTISSITENIAEAGDVTSAGDDDGGILDQATRDTPAQAKIREELNVVNAELVKLNEARNLGLGEDTNASLVKKIKDVTAKKDSLQQKMKLTEQWRKNSKRARDKRKAAIKRAETDFPGLADRMKTIQRESPGRPALEEDHPNLHRDILEIATIGAAASDRRREETFRTVKTLEDLHKALSDLGYYISRTALYHRLLPKGVSSTEAKRHVRTVPVRLVRPENNLRRKHPDRMFAAEGYNSAFKIAEIVGPKAAVAVCVDDKSSVRIGVTAAKEQRPMLMNMNVRVRLPDHDFPVGTRHALVPSVMGINRINEKGQVCYSGPTYIAVRSLKHNNSSAFTHQEDLLRIVEHFPDEFKTDDGEFKSVWIKGTDGGPDENPRFEKNINMGCKTFKEFKLDLYIEVTNAPGLSAYNKVERKMFFLSKELTGVLLPHDKYGSHLDNSGKTVDTELEIKNFEAAGNTLCEIWNRLVIDDCPTIAEFIDSPPPDSIKTFVPSAAFRDRHVFETQYMTCYMRCDDPDCCEPYVTNVELLFPHRRLPPLIPIKRDQFGVSAMMETENQKIEFLSLEMRALINDKILPTELREKFNGNVPYDFFMPSIRDKVEKRVCQKCGKYHATIKSLGCHKKLCKSGKRRTVAQRSLVDDSSSDENEETVTNLNSVSSDEADEGSDTEEIESMRPKFSVAVADSFVEKILDLKEWLRSPWSEDSNDNINA